MTQFPSETSTESIFRNITIVLHSDVTWKAGTEGMMMRMIPEVKEVVS